MKDSEWQYPAPDGSTDSTHLFVTSHSLQAGDAHPNIPTSWAKAKQNESTILCTETSFDALK